MIAAPPAVSTSNALSKINALELSLASAIRGKAEVVRMAMVCVLARGHLLIEDVPGVGKTTLAHALARSSRIDETAGCSPTMTSASSE